MKLKITILTCAMLLCSCFCFALQGDLDGDGAISPLDIPLLKDCINHPERNVDVCLSNGDMNGNGVVDIADLNRLKEEVLNPSNEDDSDEDFENTDLECTPGTPGNGDGDGDGAVSPLDLASVRDAFYKGKYNPDLDIDGNCVIDEYDIEFISETVILKRPQPEPEEDPVTTPSTGSGGSGRCTPKTIEGQWGPCHDINGVGKRYKTNIIEGCREDGTETESEYCELPVEVVETNTENTNVETNQEAPGITGNVAVDLGEGSNNYWLIALGVIVLVTGGLLYFKEK